MSFKLRYFKSVMRDLAIDNNVANCIYYTLKEIILEPEDI